MEQRLIAETSLPELIADMLAAPLRFRPGTSVGYSDYHFLLAACLIHAATGQRFETLVHERLFVPMALNDSYFPTPAEHDARTATIRGPMAEGTSGAMYNSRYARSLAHPAFGVTASARMSLVFFRISLRAVLAF